MKGYFFSDEEEYQQLDEQGKVNENNSRILLNAYISLLLTFERISEQYLKGEIKEEETTG